MTTKTTTDAMKKSDRKSRETAILLSTVELYLKTGRPIGSQTLKENGFDTVSSATIRNYFAKLESAGHLIQQHSSGGRIPTSSAYKEYAKNVYDSKDVGAKDLNELKSVLNQETREIAGYMQRAAETLSHLSGCAVFLSAPRFDQDFIVDIKLVGIDNKRCLCVLVTDFGIINTEILYTTKKLSNFSLKRMEQYFHYRMTGLDEPKLTEEEERIASQFYNEVLLRYIVGYSNFTSEDMYKTGFSHLLQFPEFRDASALAYGLSLFEDRDHMRALLSESLKTDDLSFWIGEDLSPFTASGSNCSVLAIPYTINNKPVGAIGLLGPNRIEYKKLFALLRQFANLLSTSLTNNMFKFKISYRQPKPLELELETPANAIANQVQLIALEDKTIR